MCSDLAAASHGCAFFSATGILFMSLIGVMLMKQPFFILGIDDVEKAKGSAFGAAGMFFFTFLVSILYLLKEGRRVTGIAVHGRGQINRFGEYTTVDYVDGYEPDPDISHNSEGSFT